MGSLLKLTKSNYHSLEANRQYMSNSQYRDFMNCEAMAIAKIKGDYVPEKTVYQLAGSYLHAWNEGTLDEFKVNTPAIYTKTGDLRADFKYVEKMIDCLRQDPWCMMALEGDKEVIFTAEMFGTMWRVMLDIYRPDKGRFGEIKTTKSIKDLVWSDVDSRKVSFVEAYNYPRQMAIYAQVEKLATGRNNWLEPIMVAVSKEDPPDKALLSFVDHGRFVAELAHVEINMPRILQVKNGEEKPNRCEVCDYCRSTKRLSRIMHYSELMAV